MAGMPLPCMKILFETERLFLRELEQADFAALCRTLQDERAMYAYEHAFSDEETQAWFANQQRRYREEGFGLWGVVRKADGQFLGQCGLTLQPLGDGTRGIEVGYLFERTYWHNGYATEAAIACKEYAFCTLHADTVYSIIRENNLPSRRVAERNGMHVCGRLVKHYYGMEMPHLIYRAENPHGSARVQHGQATGQDPRQE